MKKITKTGELGIELIKRFEGFRAEPYRCPANVPTIGYGATFYPGGPRVNMADKPITESAASDLLKSMLSNFELYVDSYCIDTITQNQFDALVSFCWNCGSSKTLFNMINEKFSEMNIVGFWTSHYIMGGGKVLNGLVRRRKAESVLFVKK